MFLWFCSFFNHLPAEEPVSGPADRIPFPPERSAWCIMTYLGALLVGATGQSLTNLTVWPFKENGFPLYHVLSCFILWTVVDFTHYTRYYDYNPLSWLLSIAADYYHLFAWWSIFCSDNKRTAATFDHQSANSVIVWQWIVFGAVRIANCSAVSHPLRNTVGSSRHYWTNIHQYSLGIYANLPAK